MLGFYEKIWFKVIKKSIKVGKKLSNDKSLEVNVAISWNIAWFLTRKRTENGMNKNPKNWQCAIWLFYYRKLVSLVCPVSTQLCVKILQILIESELSWFWIVGNGRFWDFCTFYVPLCLVKSSVCTVSRIGWFLTYQRVAIIKMCLYYGN